MPYITQQGRNDIKGGRPPATSGELNYLICMIVLGRLQKSMPPAQWVDTLFHVMKQYVEVNGRTYQNMNDVMGAVAGAVSEIERRTKGDFAFGRKKMAEAFLRFYYEIVAPYEDEKITANGDIFEPIDLVPPEISHFTGKEGEG